MTSWRHGLRENFKVQSVAVRWDQIFRRAASGWATRPAQSLHPVGICSRHLVKPASGKWRRLGERRRKPSSGREKHRRPPISAGGRRWAATRGGGAAAAGEIVASAYNGRETNGRTSLCPWKWASSPPWWSTKRSGAAPTSPSLAAPQKRRTTLPRPLSSSAIRLCSRSPTDCSGSGPGTRGHMWRSALQENVWVVKKNESWRTNKVPPRASGGRYFSGGGKRAAALRRIRARKLLPPPRPAAPPSPPPAATQQLISPPILISFSGGPQGSFLRTPPPPSPFSPRRRGEERKEENTRNRRRSRRPAARRWPAAIVHSIHAAGRAGTLRWGAASMEIITSTATPSLSKLYQLLAPALVLRLILLSSPCSPEYTGQTASHCLVPARRQTALPHRLAELGRPSKSARGSFISPAVCRKVVDPVADCSCHRYLVGYWPNNLLLFQTIW